MADTCMAPTARSAALTTLTSVLLLRTNSNAVRDTRTKSRHPDEPRWPTMTPRGSFGSLLKSAISSGCDDKGCDMHECKSLIRHIQQPVLHQAAPDPLLQASCLNLGPDQSLAFFLGPQPGNCILHEADNVRHESGLQGRAEGAREGGPRRHGKRRWARWHQHTGPGSLVLAANTVGPLRQLLALWQHCPAWSHLSKLILFWF